MADESSTAIYDVEVFDFNALVSRVAGKLELAERLIDTLLADSPANLRDLQECLANEDAAAMVEQAHRLKGQLDTLGILRAAGAALSLEQAARRDDLVAAELALERVCDEMSAFTEMVHARRCRP